MASGDTLVTFLPYEQEYQGSGFARKGYRGTHPILGFDLTEFAYFSFIVPRNYGGGGITVYLHYAMESAANDIRLDTAFERIGDQQQDIDSDGFASAVTGTDTTVPGNSGDVDIISNAHTNGAQIDSLAVGEGGRLKVLRSAVAGIDATGDLQLRFIELKET